jgi:hypothetical protein
MVLARRPQSQRKKLQLPPFGHRNSDKATVKPTLPTRTVAVFISGVISPSARKRDALTNGRSSIACLMHMRNRPS